VAVARKSETRVFMQILKVGEGSHASRLPLQKYLPESRFVFLVKQARELRHLFHLVEVVDHVQEFLDTIRGQSGVR
jgi:hypothetical protein